jgi:hypothetical protein
MNRRKKAAPEGRSSRFCTAASTLASVYPGRRAACTPENHRETSAPASLRGFFDEPGCSDPWSPPAGTVPRGAPSLRRSGRRCADQNRLDGLDLFLGQTLMTGLVRGLDVDQDKIVVLQGPPGPLGPCPRSWCPGSRLPPRPRSPQPAEHAEPLEQIHGRDQTAADTVSASRVSMTGRLPSPQSQMKLAVFFPAGPFSRLTGCCSESPGLGQQQRPERPPPADRPGKTRPHPDRNDHGAAQ